MSHFSESPIVGRGDIVFVNQKQKVQPVPYLVWEKIMDNIKKQSPPQKKQVLGSASASWSKQVPPPWAPCSCWSGAGCTQRCLLPLDFSIPQRLVSSTAGNFFGITLYVFPSNMSPELAIWSLLSQTLCLKHPIHAHKENVQMQASLAGSRRGGKQTEAVNNTLIVLITLSNSCSVLHKERIIVQGLIRRRVYSLAD